MRTDTALQESEKDVENTGKRTSMFFQLLNVWETQRSFSVLRLQN